MKKSISFEECKILFKKNSTYEIGFIDSIRVFDKDTHKEIKQNGKTKGNDKSKKANKTR